MKHFAFGKSRRLSSRADYLRLREAPEIVRGKYCIIFYKAATGKKSRLGMTLKGKVTSPERSRVKRVVREWFRVGFPVAAGGETIASLDLNVFMNFPFRNLGNTSIETSLRDDLRKIHGEILKKDISALS